MAGIDQYALGYTAYKADSNMSPEMLKSQHTLFRSGYRKAQQDASKRDQVLLPHELWQVTKRTHVYVPTWNDILAATRRPRYRKLHHSYMKPMLFAVIRTVEEKAHELNSFSMVRAEVDKVFESILQYSFEQGILTESDLKKFDYEPK